MTKAKKEIVFKPITKNFIYKIYSHNLLFLKSLTKFFFNNSYKTKHTNYISLLKSPHVHKKTQEQFWVVTNLLILKQKNLKNPITIKMYFMLELILNLNPLYIKKKKLIQKQVSFKTIF